MYRPDVERAPRDALRDAQLARLNLLLGQIVPANRFYARKLAGAPGPVGWREFGDLPFTTKAELVADQEAAPAVGPRLADAFRERLGLRVEVVVVPPASLPRFEQKARRVVDRRETVESRS